MKRKRLQTARGYFVILVLVYSVVFLTLISALAGYIFVEKRVQLAKENQEKALHVAEAGLEYYRWHLAHWPTDLMDGTGQPGPYQHEVLDPEGGVVGTYSLSINPGIVCGESTTVTIESTGWSHADPTYKRVLVARYSKPSVAQYSTITNSNVWVGADRVISGSYHSNGGVRMDGTHNADVSSGVASWLCTPTFGCTPTTTKNGVFGSGGPQSLWVYPAPPIDFAGITVNLAQLKEFATSSGVYIGPSGTYGWRVSFNADGTVDVRKVNGTKQIWGYSIENGWQEERTVMSNTQAATNYQIPASCPIVFVEDNVWLDGVVSGKVTLAAANIAGTPTRSIILNDNITYANTFGDGLTAIGQQDILVALQSPDFMNINGIFIAQNGKFGRNHYCTSECDGRHQGNEGLPTSLDGYVTRSILDTNGTIVSNGRIGTKWSCGGAFCSGYSQRNDSYDSELAKDPPPFTPVTSDDYKFVEWREQ